MGNDPKLHVAPRACSTCPYRRDVAPGIWSAEEYAKLRVYDEDPPMREDSLSTFKCHQEETSDAPPAVCRGWLGVHRHSVAVRLAIGQGRFGLDDVPLEAEDYLYDTGTEAATAGLRGIRRPSTKARREINKLTERRAGR